METGAGGYPPDLQSNPAFGMLPDIGSNAFADELAAPPVQPQPRYVKAPAPPPPDKEFQDYAKKYVSEYCKASYEFGKKKQLQRDIIKGLIDSTFGIREWEAMANGEALTTSQNAHKSTLDDEKTKEQWCNFVFSPSHIVNSFSANAYPQLLDGPDWLSVIDKKGKPLPAQEVPPGAEAWQIPPEMMDMEGPQAPGEEFSRQIRVQNFLLDKLGMGQIEARLYEALKTCAGYGTVYAQVFPVTVPKYEWFIDQESGEYSEQKTGENYYVVIQQIPLNRVLVDPQAKHNDVQRYRGIGHRLDRTYEQILQDFDSSLYNLNREEFETRWAASKGKPSSTDEADRDPDADDIDDPDSFLQVWAVHIKVPTLQNTIRECVCAIVTEQGDKDPETGIMVRLDMAPVIADGTRPFACAHLYPCPGPFGVGFIEDNQKLIHIISQFIGQLMDNTRMCAVGAQQVLEGGPADQFLQKVGCIAPMAKIPVGQINGEISPVQMPNFNFAAIFQLIQWLVQLLEQRTVSEAFQGADASSDSTATGDHIRFQQSMRPATTITDLFARTFVQPLARIALKMLGQMTEEDQEISIQNSQGENVTAYITPEDLQEGDYDVLCTITHQDSTRLAQAQTIRDAIPMLEELLPRLNAEGGDVSFTELVKRFLDLVKMDGSDKVITQISNKEQALQKQIQDLQSQLENDNKKPPTLSIPYELLPLEGQIQAAALAGINISQQDYLGFPSTTPPEEEPQGMMFGGNGGPSPGMGMSPPENGGPMGGEQTDQNAMAQIYQELARPGAQTQ